MRHTQALNTALLRGVSYLQTNQLPDGSFPAYAWRTTTDKQPRATAMPALLAAHIMLALTNTRQGGLEPVTNQLASWLAGHEDITWLTTQPIPKNSLGTHDLYSAFSGLLALQQHSERPLPATLLGSVAQVLVRVESQVGGPYYSYQNKDAPILDSACNCAINRFISAVAEALPNINSYLEQLLRGGNLDSAYHCQQLAAIYQIAHTCPQQLKQPLARYTLDTYQQGYWQTALETALGMSSLAAIGAHIPEGIALSLLGQQLPNGSWVGSPYAHQPNQPMRSYGAPALTTAYALEALSSFVMQQTRQLKRTGVLPATVPSNMLYETVITRSHQQTAALPHPLRRTMEQMVTRIRRADKNQEIILLPLFTAQSLARPYTLNNGALVHLGLANLYNWMAYTIYDDFLDDEGEPKLLPVANVALRYSLEAFRRALPDSPHFQQLVAATFNTIDAANAWEVARCRFAVTDDHITLHKLPNYGHRLRLAERSLSHSLPAIAILVLSGLDPHDARVIACQTAFKHYLIARQLNDDMHDWEEDVRAGQISYVVRNILDELQVPMGTVPFSKLIPRMKRQFWNVTLARTCQDITEHTTRGRLALQRSKLLNELNIISKLLDNLDGVVAHSLAERERAEDFLRAYRQRY